MKLTNDVMQNIFAASEGVTVSPVIRGRPNFGFGFLFGFGAEFEQMVTFGGHSVSVESSRTTFGALSVSACCSW